jgi:hypothetical protein
MNHTADEKPHSFYGVANRYLPEIGIGYTMFGTYLFNPNQIFA